MNMGYALAGSCAAIPCGSGLLCPSGYAREFFGNTGCGGHTTQTLGGKPPPTGKLGKMDCPG
jgi:hypothetical protein